MATNSSLADTTATQANHESRISELEKRLRALEERVEKALGSTTKRDDAIGGAGPH